MKVLVITKQFCAEGGAGIVTTLIVDALLQFQHQVCVICYQADDFDKFKNLIGIEFKGKKLMVKRLTDPAAKFFQKSGYLSSFYLMHLAKSKKFSDYTLFSAWDEMDFGRRGLQYIHWAAHHPYAASVSAPFKNSISRKVSVVYRTLVSTFFGFNKESVKHNISIFNSKFTQEKFEELYGKTTGYVVHPPIMVDTKYAKYFCERENGFVYSGRISPDKNIHFMLEAVGKLREAGYNLHFHVVGPASNPDYASELQTKYAADWVSFEGTKNRDALSKILGQHKYSIQGRYIEPFGMAAAEACKLGCLTFMPRRSGFSELVDESKLKFDDFSDFYNKFCTLAKDEKKQEILSNKLQSYFSHLTAESFQQQIQTIFSNMANDVAAAILKEV